jgi:hypothetical protein
MKHYTQIINAAKKFGYHTLWPDDYSELIQYFELCLLQKWLREKHLIHIEISIDGPETRERKSKDPLYMYSLFQYNKKDSDNFNIRKESPRGTSGEHDLIFQRALIQALKLLKQKLAI